MDEQGKKQPNGTQDSPVPVDYADAVRGGWAGEEVILNEREYADMRVWRAEREMNRLVERLSGGLD